MSKPADRNEPNRGRNVDNRSNVYAPPETRARREQEDSRAQAVLDHLGLILEHSRFQSRALAKLAGLEAPKE